MFQVRIDGLIRTASYRHQILCAVRRMLAVEVRDIGKHTPEMGKTRQAQLTAVPLAEQAEDGSGRHISSLD